MRKFWPVTETGLGAAQIRAGRPELGGRPEPAGGLRVPVAVEDGLEVLAALARRDPDVAAQPVGVERPRQQVVDGDVVPDGLTRDPGDEAGQPGARTVRQAQRRDRRLDRDRGDVDDAAEAAVDHAVDGRLDELDRGQHVGAERGDPVLAPPVPEIPGRRTARVVDQNVGLWARGEHGGPAFLGRDVGGDGGDRYTGRGPDFVGGGLQRIAVTGIDDHIHPFLRQRHGAAPAEALARGADNRLFVSQSQVHGALPPDVGRLG